jgi:glycosyltransferase involved in cell wall biosynthesis
VTRPPTARHVVLAVTDPVSLQLMAGLPSYLRGRGWTVTVVAGSCADDSEVVVVSMARNPSLLTDVQSLSRWTRFLRQQQPEVVVAGTPKAGLLGVLASRLVGVERRVYLLRGLRLETFSGVRRYVHLMIERLAVWCSTDVICVSASLRDEYVRLRLGRPEKAVVLGRGSSNGVDTERFLPATAQQRCNSRVDLGLRPELPVIGFVGRLTPDKGLDYLAAALNEVIGKHPAQLLVVGSEERPDYTRELQDLLDVAGVPHRFHERLGDVTQAYEAMDVLCLPSLREGFPNVCLEASASGVPVITTFATGCRDAVVPGTTGWLVEPKNARMLAEALGEALGDLEAAAERGAMGRHWVVRNFSRPQVWNALAEFLEVSHRRPESAEPSIKERFIE